MTFGIYSAQGSPEASSPYLERNIVFKLDALWSCAMPIKNFNGHDELIECCKGIARDDDE